MECTNSTLQYEWYFIYDTFDKIITHAGEEDEQTSPCAKLRSHLPASRAERSDVGLNTTRAPTWLANCCNSPSINRLSSASAPHMQSNMSFIIQDIRLFDGESIIEKTRVLVKDGIISQIGPDIEDPNAVIISRPGHTLLPGLIDAHCHPYHESRLPEQAFRFGITTIMDLHNLDENAKVQKQLARERRDFPDVKSSHFAATIENGWPAWVEKRLSNNEVLIFPHSHSPIVLRSGFVDWSVIQFATYDDWPNVKSEQDAELFVQRAAADGADYIKLMHEAGKAIGIEPGLINQPTESVQAAVVRAAHKRGLKVIAHALSLADTLVMLRAGVDGMAHTFFDEPITPEVIDLYKRNNVWVNPTIVAAGTLTGESAEIAKEFSKDPRVGSKLDTKDFKLMQSCLHMKAPGAKWEYAIDSVRQLRTAGVDIIW
jgi:hypothetical protein